MSSRSIRLEVLPVANRLLYEKSLIGQLFNNTEPNPAVPKVTSPFLVHKLTPSNTSTPSPEPPASQTSSASQTLPTSQTLPASQTPPQKEEELQPSRHTPVQTDHHRVTPSPPVSASPTMKDGGESPTPKKIPDLVNMINKKSGKKMKIDFKKGKLDVKSNQYPLN